MVSGGVKQGGKAWGPGRREMGRQGGWSPGAAKGGAEESVEGFADDITDGPSVDSRPS